MKKIAILLILLNFILLSGCAQKITIRYLKPPEINVGKIRKIAVLPFTGRGSEEVANILTSKLFEGRLSLTGMVDPGRISITFKIVDIETSKLIAIKSIS